MMIGKQLKYFIILIFLCCVLNLFSQDTKTGIKLFNITQIQGYKSFKAKRTIDETNVIKITDIGTDSLLSFGFRSIGGVYLNESWTLGGGVGYRYFRVPKEKTIHWLGQLRYLFPDDSGMSLALTYGTNFVNDKLKFGRKLELSAGYLIDSKSAVNMFFEVTLSYSTLDINRDILNYYAYYDLGLNFGVFF